MAADLAEFVALRSVSSPTPDRPALAEASSWLARRLTALGARGVRVTTAGGLPVVLGERPGPPGAPRLLCYGHFDVVAPGLGWSTPPFDATVLGGRMSGRGTADDKGPLLAQLRAAAQRPSPVGWKFLYDGGEELGSPGLPALLGRLRGWLADVDAVLVCDTEATHDGRPTLTRSLRGQLTVELSTRRAGPALHAGRFGGAVPDPARALARLVASLHRADGSIAVPGLTDAVRPLPHLAPADLDRRLAPYARPGWGEPGRSPAERVTERPAVVVTALCAGDCAPGPWHVIPPRARAKINIRLVPDQGPDTAFAQLGAHLAGRAPAGITVGLRRLVAAHPWAGADAGGPGLRAAAGAVRDVWGRPPVLVRSGGTVPAVSLLARAAPRAELILLGVTMPGDNAHAPDEHVELARLDATAATVGRLAQRLARTGGPR